MLEILKKELNSWTSANAHFKFIYLKIEESTLTIIPFIVNPVFQFPKNKKYKRTLKVEISEKTTNLS